MNLLRNKTNLLLLAILVVFIGTAIIYFSYVAIVSIQQKNVLSAQPANGEIKVKLIINDGKSQKTYDKNLPAGSTVLDLLEQSSQTKKFSLSYRQSQLGVFIEEIAGVKNDNRANKFWLYKVNGKLANVGASSYLMKNNDAIEWYYGTVTDFK
jgi:hypothetical protein